MTPQHRGVVPPAAADRLVRAQQLAAAADALLRDAVVLALADGASYREVSALTGISTNTIARWVRESDGPPPAGRVRAAQQHQAQQAWEERLRLADADRARLSAESER